MYYITKLVLLLLFLCLFPIIDIIIVIINFVLKFNQPINVKYYSS
jgi:hypothetical protein